MLALVPEEHLDAGHGHAGLELVDHGQRLGVGDAPGAPVGERAVGAEGGEVAAGGDVAGAQLEVESRGRQRAASELELLGVVAEEPEVTGSRAGGDAGPDRLEHAGGALAHELVEVRGGRFLELGAVVGVGVAAQPVHHDEQDLGVGRLDQRRQVHDQNATCRRSARRPPEMAHHGGSVGTIRQPGRDDSFADSFLRCDRGRPCGDLRCRRAPRCEPFGAATR